MLAVSKKHEAASLGPRDSRSVTQPHALAGGKILLLRTKPHRVRHQQLAPLLLGGELGANNRVLLCPAQAPRLTLEFIS